MAGMISSERSDQDGIIQMAKPGLLIAATIGAFVITYTMVKFTQRASEDATGIETTTLQYKSGWLRSCGTGQVFAWNNFGLYDVAGNA